MHTLHHLWFLDACCLCVSGCGACPQSLLAPRWQRLVCRDARGLPAAGGEVWAAPYRWGCTLVAFQSDKLLR